MLRKKFKKFLLGILEGGQVVDQQTTKYNNKNLPTTCYNTAKRPFRRMTRHPTQHHSLSVLWS